MASEFDIIRKHFSFSSPAQANDVLLGVGDDAAMLASHEDRLIVASDTLVEGVHFLAGTAPENIAHRAVAVNVSDFAAMGANPRWCTLSLTIPDNDPDWLSSFSQALASDLDSHGIALVGGDTCHGPMNISLTMIGEPNGNGEVLQRSGALAGDDIWVSGVLGESAIGLALQKGSEQFAALSASEKARYLAAFHSPEPRLSLGQGLLGLANAAMDISDGLLADAAHLARQSGVCIAVQRNLIPVPEALDDLSSEEAIQLAISGDDYELLFSVSADRRAEVLALAEQLCLPLTRVGEAVHASAADGWVMLMDGERQLALPDAGYRHF